MAITIAPQYTQRAQRWAAWKAVQGLKKFAPQFDDDGTTYTIWGYDGPEAHLCTIWVGEVPLAVVEAGYSQEQNDADKADFDANFKSAANGAIVVRTPDGRTVTAANGYPTGTILQISGRGDDRTDGRGKGQALFFANKTPGDYTLEWAYTDSVWITGGGAWVAGSDDSGDHFSFSIYCPATAVVPNGAGHGNCNVYGGVIVPADGNGAYDVDLTNANPIPAPGGAGYFDWDAPETGLGNVTVAVPGKGNSLLIAADVPLNVFATDVHFVGTTHAPFIVPNVVASHLWPFWRVKLDLHVESADIDFACYVILARFKTV